MSLQSYAVLLSAVVFAGLLSSPPSVAMTPELTRPASLEPDIAFWRRVYTEITTAQGFVHDDARLDIVYATVSMGATGSGRRGVSRAEQAATTYTQILRTLATGKRKDLSAEESRVLALWGPNADNATFKAASERVRVQRGQADKFREGLVRSGAWMPYIEQTFADAGVPKEIAALPHVESSFNPMARSFVGAVGLWQFMRSTGRRYMQIDSAVDERLDPYRSSAAAALLMRQNYAVTSSWPLAITAYNHGAGGMLRAVKQVGTEDVAKIVREYKSKSFGFASRNFYVAFLAAFDVSSQAESFFGQFERDPPDPNPIVELPGYTPSERLLQAFDVDRETLAALNPSLLPSVWSGKKLVPKGFKLRIPARDGLDPSTLLASIGNGAWGAKQAPDLYHVVQRGETLSTIAPRYGTRVADLMSINGLASANRIHEGQKLALPGAIAAGAEPVVADGVYPKAAHPVVAKVNKPVVARPVESDEGAASAATPGTPTLAEANGGPAPEGEEDAATLTQGEDTAPAADPNDYTVASDGTIRIQEGEALANFATWLDVDVVQLRKLNSLKPKSSIRSGERLKLDFAKVAEDEFEQRRLDYHREIQERFFTRYRIAGTNEHIVKAGESVWVLAERRYKVPVWLLRQYNPDIDLEQVRPGTKVVIPVLEARDA